MLSLGQVVMLCVVLHPAVGMGTTRNSDTSLSVKSSITPILTPAPVQPSAQACFTSGVIQTSCISELLLSSGTEASSPMGRESDSVRYSPVNVK